MCSYACICSDEQRKIIGCDDNDFLQLRNLFINYSTSCTKIVAYNCIYQIGGSSILNYLMDGPFNTFDKQENGWELFR